MTDSFNPFDLSPLKDRLQHGRACTLFIDGVRCMFQHPDSLRFMKRYAMAVPKFATLAPHYGDAIHIAQAHSEKGNAWERYKNNENPLIYSEDNLRIQDPDVFFDENADEDALPLPVDFLHPFDPRDDLYYQKGAADALADGVIGKFILEKSYDIVMVAGAAFKWCYMAGICGLDGLRTNHHPDLKIVALCDLTDNGCEDEPIEVQKQVVHQRLMVEGLQGSVYVAAAQDILSTWNDKLDLDLPTTENQRLIEQQKTQHGYDRMLWKMLHVA